MRRVLVLLIVVFCAGGAAKPLLAQKTAPAITRDSDRDGVPEPRDRCPRTPPNTRVDENGCPVATPAPTTPAPAAAAPPAAAPAPAPTSTAANQPRPDTGRARPTGLPGPAPGAAPGAVTPPAAAPGSAASQPVTQAAPGAAAPPTSAPSGAQPAGAQPTGTQPAGAAQRPAAPPGSAPSSAPAGSAPGAVTTPTVSVPVPAAVPSAPPRAAPAAPAAPAAAAPAASAAPVDQETAGYWIAVYNGRTDAEQLAYVRLLVAKIDTAVIGIVETFRNTSGNPVAGATDPGRLTRREKDRWLRCRNIGNDMRTMSDAAASLKDSVAGGPALQRAMVGLADAFEALQALEGCDVINSMVESPDRFNPWQANYENEARNFYRDWYAQVRAVHSAAREVARAGRFVVPAAIATAPPYVGAAR